MLLDKNECGYNMPLWVPIKEPTRYLKIEISKKNKMG